MIGFFIVLSASAYAVLRVMPRSDYGINAKSNFEALADFSDNLGSSLTNNKLGGERDVVFSAQVSANGIDLLVYSCPSIQLCEADPIACLNDPKYWTCKKQIQINMQESCALFKSRKRMVHVMNFLRRNVMGNILSMGTNIFSTGLGLAFSQASSVANAVSTGNSIYQVDCQLFEMGSPLFNSGLTLMNEKDKGDVLDLLSIFTKPRVHRTNQYFHGKSYDENDEFLIPDELIDIPN